MSERRLPWVGHDNGSGVVGWEEVWAPAAGRRSPVSWVKITKNVHCRPLFLGNCFARVSHDRDFFVRGMQWAGRVSSTIMKEVKFRNNPFLSEV